MGQTLYLECMTGISGDMTVAALLDLGADQEVLRKALDSLPVPGFSIEISRVKKAGLDVCDFHVRLDAEHENHDHDMEYLYGHAHRENDHAHRENDHAHRENDHAHGEDGHGHGEHSYEHGAHEHSHSHEEDHHSQAEHIHGLTEHIHDHGGHDHSHDHEEDHHSQAEHIYGLTEHDHDHGEHSHSHDHDGHSHSYTYGDHDHSEHGHDHGEHDHSHDYGEHDHSHDHGEHDHSHDHGEHDRSHDHGDHGHSHDHGDHDHSHTHHHEHRGLPEILEIIEQAKISDRAKKIAARIFTVLAQAEAKAHGAPIEQVHFHEVGAVDSIVDIIAAAVCLDDLDITEVIVPALHEGRGTVRCQHGILPIPVPAVAAILQAHGIPLKIVDMEGELVTPTGAAIVAAMRTSGQLPKIFTVKGVGVGAGKRQYERPSLLRAMLLEAEQEQQTDEIYKLETNMDDCTGEALGYVQKKLLEAGARDVYYIPIYMKKNRPAYELNVICDQAKVRELERIIFRETTTIGIRRAKMERTVLQRETGSIKLHLGELQIKKCVLPDGQERWYPEYDSVVRLAETNGLSYQQVMEAFMREGRTRDADV